MKKRIGLYEEFPEVVKILGEDFFLPDELITVYYENNEPVEVIDCYQEVFLLKKDYNIEHVEVFEGRLSYTK